MKKIILVCFVSFSLFAVAGCFKDDGCKSKTPQSEDAAMQDYAAANSMTVIKHSTGLYYQIVNQGTGPAPTASSRISVRYTGKLLNGTIFDVATTATGMYPLSGFITGWQIGIPLINKGGTIRLIVPSLYGYGCQANGAIPANSILFFEIELVDIM